MNSLHRSFIAAAVLIAASHLHAQASISSIYKQIDGLRALSAEKRPAATVKVAKDIAALPASTEKVKLADSVAHLVTEGDQGIDTEQAVADALSQALVQSPVAPKKDVTPEPYLDLARLVRYEGVKTTLVDPLYVKARQTLIDNDTEISKADFTLKDIKGKKVTLSELRGKIVLVNFWATWCPPCLAEMPSLDFIHTHFKDQGLVVLSITSEDLFKVGPFLSSRTYNPTVLLDTGGKVAKQFHVDGFPRTFIFGRDGKLIGETIDQRTGKQFLMMLAQTDLHP